MYTLYIYICKNILYVVIIPLLQFNSRLKFTGGNHLQQAILVHHDHDVQYNWEHLNRSREVGAHVILIGTAHLWCVKGVPPIYINSEMARDRNLDQIYKSLNENDYLKTAA